MPTADDYQAEIPKMLDMIEQRIDSDENLRRLSLWDENGNPLGKSTKIPVTVSPEIQMWAKVTGVNLVDYYRIPEAFVYATLKVKLFAFDTFADDQPLDRGIWMWWGTPFEGSLFGIDYEFLLDVEPEPMGRHPYATCREAAMRIRQPDFFRAGMMPLVHNVYEQCKQLLPDSYEISFPDYIQNPLSTAFHLLGGDALLTQILTDTESAEQLLTRLIDIRLQYRRERAEFTDTEFGPGIFDNDLVCVPMISPQLYRDVVWPIENKLANDEGGVEYWHSCGNTTEMLELVTMLPSIDLLHISAWTDRSRAGQVVNKEQALQVCVHSIKEVLMASDDEIETSLMEIIDNLGEHRIKIDADCFQTFMDMPEQIQKIQHWIDIAQKITKEHAKHQAFSMNEAEAVYLAFDLGATSWRATLGYDEGQVFRLEEMYRESNEAIERQGGLFWNIEKIFYEMLQILRNVAERGIRLSGIGIDSWSVDYGLLDKDDCLLEMPRCYRDARNQGMAAKVASLVDADSLFERTGVMAEDIATLCQLMAAREQTPDLLKRAECLLWIPDLFRFRLCGEKATDFTLATTSQLYNLSDRKWDRQLMEQLGLPGHLLPGISSTNLVLGYLTESVQSKTGLGNVPVAIGASHDTAAAFFAAQADEDSVILSSGTWSIIGVNLKAPLSGVKIDSNRFGYEGNVDGSVRLISNVPGMYLIERCRDQWKKQGREISYEELLRSARGCGHFQSVVDPFWDGFINPKDMTEAIASYCRRNSQDAPETIGEYVRVICTSLALSYAKVIEQLRAFTGKKLETLVVLGGGSQNILLNDLTAERAKVKIRIGCVEASTIGNIMSQRAARKATARKLGK